MKLTVGMRVKLNRQLLSDDEYQRQFPGGGERDELGNHKWLAEGKGFVPNGTLGAVTKGINKLNGFSFYHIVFDGIESVKPYRFGVSLNEDYKQFLPA